MIGKITTGKSFNKLINYLYKEGQNPKTIYNATIGDTPQEIAAEFNRVAQRRPTTQNPCKHIICSFAPEDGKVSEFVKEDIAGDIANQLGYTDNQYLVVEHGRQADHHDHIHDHDHIHIVINAIGYDGKRTNDFRDKSRLERFLRQLESQYKLTPVKSSRYSKTKRQPRRPRTKAYRHFIAEYHQWESQLETNPQTPPPPEPEIQQIQSIILAAIEDKPSLSVYLARMQQHGYRVEFFKTPKGRRRLRYYLKQPENQGRFVTNLSGGSLTQLKAAGVNYVPRRDNQAIEAVKTGRSLEIEKHLHLPPEAIAKYQYQWLDKAKRDKIRQHLQQLRLEYKLNKVRTERESKMNLSH